MARIKLGLQKKLYLGNLDAKRDWGHAKDYVEAQWLVLQQDEPDDYVIATGEHRSVREFVEASFREVGIEIEWKGIGIDEKGIVSSLTSASALHIGETLVEIDPRYFRPTEVESLFRRRNKGKGKTGLAAKGGI